MNRKYFVSLEFHDFEATSKLLPCSEKYGFDGVMGLSQNFGSDIEAINLSQKILAGLDKGKLEIKEEYNKAFFGHLDSNYTFNNQNDVANDDTKIAMMDEHFTLHKTKFNNDEGENIGTIYVCEKPTPSKLDEVNEIHEKFLSHSEAVSSRHKLN